MILRSLDPLYLLNFFKGLDFEVSRILPDGDIEKATVKETDILNLENLCAFRKM